MDIPFLLAKSLCRHCQYRVTRDVSTEGLHIMYDDGTEIEDDLVSFLDESCAILGKDLDHIVLDCTAFKNKDKC